MPTFRNIDISFQHPAALATIPEFPPPKFESSSPSSTSADTDAPPLRTFPPLLQANTVNVFLPTYPRHLVWISYTIHPPVTNGNMYYFELLINGKLFESWGCTKEDKYKGKFKFGMWLHGVSDPEGSMVYLRRSLYFGPEEPELTLGMNERVIEIKVYRARARRPLPGRLDAFQESELWQKGIGRFYDEPKTVEEKGNAFQKMTEKPEDVGKTPKKASKEKPHEVNTTAPEANNGNGFEEGLRLIPGGVVTESDPEHPVAFFEYSLIDAVDAPLAVFRYHYQQLHEMGIWAPSEIDYSSVHEESFLTENEEADSFFNSPTEDAMHPERVVLFEEGQGFQVRHPNIITPQTGTKKPLPPLPISPPSPAEEDISPILGPFSKAIQRDTSPTQLIRHPIRTSSLPSSIGSSSASRDRSETSGDTDMCEDSIDYTSWNRSQKWRTPPAQHSFEGEPTSACLDEPDKDIRSHRLVETSLPVRLKYNLPKPPPLPLTWSQIPGSRRASTTKDNTPLEEEEYMRGTDSPTPTSRGRRWKSPPPPRSSSLENVLESLSSASEIPAPLRPPPIPPLKDDFSTKRHGIVILPTPSVAVYGTNDSDRQDDEGEKEEAIDRTHGYLQFPEQWEGFLDKNGRVAFMDVVREIHTTLVPARTVISGNELYPEGWEVRYSALDGSVYFFNKSSGARRPSWPRGLKLGDFGLPPRWVTEIGRDGRVNFFNKSLPGAKGVHTIPGFERARHRRRHKDKSPPPPVPEIPERFKFPSETLSPHDDSDLNSIDFDLEGSSLLSLQSSKDPNSSDLGIDESGLELSRSSTIFTSNDELTVESHPPVPTDSAQSSDSSGDGKPIQSSPMTEQDGDSQPSRRPNSDSSDSTTSSFKSAKADALSLETGRSSRGSQLFDHEDAPKPNSSSKDSYEGGSLRGESSQSGRASTSGTSRVNSASRASDESLLPQTLKKRSMSRLRDMLWGKKQ